MKAEAPLARGHQVFYVLCPGCGRELRGRSEDARRERVLQHVRNCRALNFGRSQECVPLDQVATQEGPR